jgi:hypothetical protein
MECLRHVSLIQYLGSTEGMHANMRERLALGIGMLLIVASLLGASLTLGSPMVASAEGAGGMMGGWESMQEMMNFCASAMDGMVDSTGDR